MKFFIDMHVVLVGDQSLLFCLPLLSDQAPPALGGLWALCRNQVKVVRLNVAFYYLSGIFIFVHMIRISWAGLDCWWSPTQRPSTCSSPRIARRPWSTPASPFTGRLGAFPNFSLQPAPVQEQHGDPRHHLPLRQQVGWGLFQTFLPTCSSPRIARRPWSTTASLSTGSLGTIPNLPLQPAPIQQLQGHPQ